MPIKGELMKKYIIAAAMVAAAACALYAQAGTDGEKPAAPAVKVEKIVTAAGVEEKEPVGEAKAFGEDTTRVFTWTRIAAEQPPVTVTHNYYFGGKRVAQVELDIKSSPYRVWSSKAVGPGEWKVEVTDEAGKVLATARFTVGGKSSEDSDSSETSESAE
ncbi:MAG: hypothetical protein FD189_2553 [Elusimicrobia bacterium]|nr:MAG: hypothetical protein FD154_2523 [Elusimicrobiota bacterium]KAF0151563.1 MAG: hypothetical protein FD189_2553 [Elusimicrobiota bacterium]